VSGVGMPAGVCIVRATVDGREVGREPVVVR